MEIIDEKSPIVDRLGVLDTGELPKKLEPVVVERIADIYGSESKESLNTYQREEETPRNRGVKRSRLTFEEDNEPNLQKKQEQMLLAEKQKLLNKNLRYDAYKKALERNAFGNGRHPLLNFKSIEEFRRTRASLADPGQFADAK